MRLCRMCWNPRVLGVLAAAALIALVAAPGRFTEVAPVLVALVCPLSMGAAVWAMRGNRGGSAASMVRPSDAQRRIHALEAQLAELRTRRAGPQP